MRSPIVTVTIQKASGASGEERTAAQDYIAVEEPLQIRLAKRDLAITMRTPGHDRELAAGFLFTEGILSSPSQVASIDADERGTITVRPKAGVDAGAESRHFYVTSSCGVCGKASIEALHAAGCNSLAGILPHIRANVILSLPEKLRSAQQVFEHTGGLHAAGLFRADGELLELREDVGRHNAVDKLIGAAFLAGQLPLHNCILMLSGRVSFELVQKAVMAGIPAVAAVGAPSSLATETARRFGVTLIGFLRDRRFNIYSGEVRLAS
ncbi:MAG: formate dehydrogenase accessory sulfurtransferase FdhD [Bryobacteraceae bacterium]